ncbi:MAG: polyheme membrane-associated cytochrome C, partial [Planctomycetota bacterium]
DYDGDGDIYEGIAGEIETLAEILYVALQNYATTVAGTPIIYDSHSYPYFFVDTNGNGLVDAGESSYGNRYNAFTPRLLKAAYNYQYAQKDPGAFAHNGKYVAQVLSATVADIAR